MDACLWSSGCSLGLLGLCVLGLWLLQESGSVLNHGSGDE